MGENFPVSLELLFLHVEPILGTVVKRRMRHISIKCEP